MKKLLFVIIAIFLSTISHAGWFSKDEPKKKEPPKPTYCNYSIRIAAGVFYIFKGGCQGFTQIGIVDTNEKKLIHLSPTGKQKKVTSYENNIEQQKDLESVWGPLNTVKFSGGR